MYMHISQYVNFVHKSCEHEHIAGEASRTEENKKEMKSCIDHQARGMRLTDLTILFLECRA